MNFKNKKKRIMKKFMNAVVFIILITSLTAFVFLEGSLDYTSPIPLGRGVFVFLALPMAVCLAALWLLLEMFSGLKIFNNKDHGSEE